jgi:WD40 repeat protein
VFQNKLENSIGCIAISPSGRYIAATSMSDNHEIAVYDINDKSLIAFGKGPRSVIYQIKFNLEEDQIICACAK